MYFCFYIDLYLRNLNSSFFVSCIMVTYVSGMMWLEFQVQTSLLLFGCPDVSDSLGPHGPQHARPLCPSPSPEVCPSLYPLHWWCRPTISSSDVPFSFCLQSFPASGTFPLSCLFTSDHQNPGVSASASILPMSIQGWFPLRLTGLI